MALLYSVLYAFHAKGTHHKLAFDGLQALEVPDAERWRRLLLKHAEPLMRGAKAPDDEFKDFKNHVLHPRDGNWGGAPTAARQWYARLVKSLAEARWPDAAYEAGVLSHYVTDPVHPFHTQQSEAESCIHRAFEWSTATSYDALKIAAGANGSRRLATSAEAGWLEALLIEAATEANRHYEKLIAHYDIHRGVVDPPTGLDPIARRIVGEMIELASGVFAAVLARAIGESKATPPDVSLTLESVLATITIPFAKWKKRIADAGERALVQKMYDELMQTGTVDTYLPEDDRTIKSLHAAEIVPARPVSIGLSKSEAVPDSTAARPVEPHTLAGRLEAVRRASDRSPRETLATVTNEVASPITPAPGASRPSGPSVPLIGGRSRAGDINPPIESKPSNQVPIAVEPAPSTRDHAPEILPPSLPEAQIDDTEPRAGRTRSVPLLNATDDVVDAPSIGPRMAQRLAPLGIRTVGDLLVADPNGIATRLAMRGIDHSTVRDWQDQARLACLVPGLRGGQAQLLVGAGYRTVAGIAEDDPDLICAAVLRFALSPAGQRILRQGEPPDIERIRAWIEAARSAEAA